MKRIQNGARERLETLLFQQCLGLAKLWDLRMDYRLGIVI